MIPPSAFALPGLPPAFSAQLVQAAAADRLALVGGAVRDLLLHRVHQDPWLGVPDLDLVVEAAAWDEGTALPTATAAAAIAPAHRLARRLRQLVGPEHLLTYQEHGAYGTVELELDLPDGPLLLDLASARLETYPEAGENPLVRFGSLDDDLARRDFSINAMALLLSRPAGTSAAPVQEGVFPELLDPHGGQADLARRQLRLLHGASLRDDPTRIVRGARYAARLGFELAPESLEQLHHTLALWPWAWRPGDPPQQAPSALGTRLRMELELLLEREAWPRALAALQRWGALPLIDAALQSDRSWRRRLRWAGRLGLPLLPALLVVAAQPLAVAERLQLPHRQHRLLAQGLELERRLAAAAAEHGVAMMLCWSPSRWCLLLEAPGLSAEAVALALVGGLGVARACRRPLWRWWGRWRHLRADLGAGELLAAGMLPGPALGERLRQLRAERLDRERP
ncbi:MAG: CCA tRNA nucleotidyltransferase [Synechococcaceae cyanobacterium ELA263]